MQMVLVQTIEKDENKICETMVFIKDNKQYIFLDQTIGYLNEAEEYFVEKIKELGVSDSDEIKNCLLNNFYEGELFNIQIIISPSCY